MQSSLCSKRYLKAVQDYESVCAEVKAIKTQIESHEEKFLAAETAYQQLQSLVARVESSRQTIQVALNLLQAQLAALELAKALAGRALVVSAPVTGERN